MLSDVVDHDVIDDDDYPAYDDEPEPGALPPVADVPPVAASTDVGMCTLNAAALQRNDEDRRRDEVRIASLQHQVDELRAAIRESSSRSTREQEAAKAQDTAIAQLKLSMDQMRQEFQQGAQARSLRTEPAR